MSTHQQIEETTEKIKLASEPLRQIIGEVGRVLVGQDQLVHRMLIGLLTGGHLLISKRLARSDAGETSHHRRGNVSA